MSENWFLILGTQCLLNKIITVWNGSPTSPTVIILFVHIGFVGIYNIVHQG